MARTGSRRLLFVLSAFGGVAVALVGALLLWRYREATLGAAAEREQLILEARARRLSDELEALQREIGRLSQLAEVDLADGNLEPEKVVLRAARHDSATFSVTVAVLDDAGHVLWAEPREPREPRDPAALVGLARGRGRPVARFGEGEIDVAAPIAGQGAIAAIVGAEGKDLVGDELRRALRGRGGVALVAADSRGAERVVAEARAGGAPPPLRLGRPGQAWLTDAGGARWLVGEAEVGRTGLLLRSVLSAEEVEGDLSAPFRRLAAVVVVAIALAVGGGLALSVVAARLERAERELGRAQDLAAMGKTAAAIAHEVKNALNGISVGVDVLADGRSSRATVEAVHRRARAEVGRLREVAEDLTLFAAAPSLSRAEVDLGELCRQAAEAAGELATDCGVTVRLDLPRAPVPCRCDAPKLLSALGNLVRNGVEAMGPGAFGEPLGEERPPGERALDVALRVERGAAIVEVADRGPGLAPAVRERLFEPFVTTKRSGTGLGLVIARRVVEAHGGRISAGDRPGGGTIFRVELALEAAAPKEATWATGS